MEKRQTWFLFFDLDGTLAQNDCPPSPGTVRALRSARAAGHKVFLCTGRVKCDIYKEIWDIGFDGAICGAGTHIYTPKRRILCETIPLLLLRQAVEVMRTLSHYWCFGGRAQAVYCAGREASAVENAAGMLWSRAFKDDGNSVFHYASHRARAIRSGAQCFERHF